MSGQYPKHGLSAILVFSLAAGVFCAVISIIGTVILAAPGSLAQSEMKDFLIPAGAGFLIVFVATLASDHLGLSNWFFKDQMGGRVGTWQRAPAWFTRLMNHFIKGEAGRHRN